ncbi:hypothetical protein AtDm6_2845 [Acetobacter tropicalis]|uniref:Uncharacterized protein n=1 Tax=Acetobacter tropicalis TaxID=104102 RepID=A0A094YKP8_9PROT|nr:hypothetical protein AtDm6_2845 [Acetobacter tropicalis]
MCILVVNPSWEQPDFAPPFSGCRVLVGADNGAIDHQTRIVAIGGQRGEYPLPHTRMAAAAEAPVDCLPVTIVFRQVAPVGAGSQYP